ncbi:MAG TPA: hypothetical protein PK722_07135, partial [Kiritimatiellia bacterium]|nr:hypothetical protein [Kiritimatiellia bacterium]
KKSAYLLAVQGALEIGANIEKSLKMPSKRMKIRKKGPKRLKRSQNAPNDRKISRRPSNDWNFFPGPPISLVRPAASARIRGLWKSR